MVFARTKLMIEDNCFEEEPSVVEMRFVGPNITQLYEKVYEAMRSVFHVPDSDIQEITHNWAHGEKGEKFNMRWWLHKDMDLFTYFFIRFDLKGQGNEKSGHAVIRIKGLLRTEYPQDTLWQRSLFYEMLRTFWHRMYYRKKREEFAEECRHSIIFFQKKMREFYEDLRKEK